MATSSNNFDFEHFNLFLEGTQASTKAMLINQLLGEIVVNTVTYRSPLQNMAMSVYADSDDLVLMYKNTVQKDGFNTPDWKKLMTTANAGLKIYLVTQLIGAVIKDSIINQQKQIAKEAMALSSVCNHFREQWKEQSAKAQANKAGQVQTTTMPKMPDSPVFDANEHAPAPF